jgi:hypothetical protein
LQAVIKMAREVDPQGLRTIGVLTKPDTIEAGTHQPWVKVLQVRSSTVTGPSLGACAVQFVRGEVTRRPFAIVDGMQALQHATS